MSLWRIAVEMYTFDHEPLGGEGGGDGGEGGLL